MRFGTANTSSWVGRHQLPTARKEEDSRPRISTAMPERHVTHVVS